MPGPPGEKGESGHVGLMVSTAKQSSHVEQATKFSDKSTQLSLFPL